VFTIKDAGYWASATLANWAIERLVHTPNALADTGQQRHPLRERHQMG
jgi:hypothetical protein